MSPNPKHQPPNDQEPTPSEWLKKIPQINHPHGWSWRPAQIQKEQKEKEDKEK